MERLPHVAAGIGEEFTAAVWVKDGGQSRTGAAAIPTHALSSLIAPVSTGDFLEQYFERDVLHVARRDRAYFEDLYGVDRIEDALLLGASHPECFAMVKQGSEPIAVDDLIVERRAFRPHVNRGPRRVLDARAVLAAFADGYSLTIKDAGAFSPALARRCDEIAAEFGIYAQVNAYFTPPHARGFGLHYDTHQTLIAQIEGEKHWEIYAPVVALPLETQPFNAAEHADKLGPARRFTLRAGDSLYVPHGFPHVAATGAERSLHLTFSLSPLRVVDVLEKLVQLVARGDVELRRALPPTGPERLDFAALLGPLLTERLAQAMAPECITAALELARNELFAAVHTPSAGIFHTLTAATTLHAGSRITLRDDTPFELRARGERLDVVVAAKIVNVPAMARRGFARLLAGPATLAELEAVLPENCAAFVKTMAAEGLVRVDG